MKKTFQNVADKLNLKLIYARPNLANVKLDNLSYSDFNEDGLALIVSPLYTTGLPIDKVGRVHRLFEIAVVALHDLDFNDEDLDDILHKCELSLMKIVNELQLDVNSANQFVSKYDINLCGVFINTFFTNKGAPCLYEVKENNTENENENK